MASLARLRARFRDVAAVVEGLGALRSLGGEEALIEMAMFAQSHEQTVELAWRALADCEQAARLACSALVPSHRAPSDPGAALSTDPAPALLSSAAPADDEVEGPVTQVDATPSRVLVVDDDPTVLRAFRRVLSPDHEIVTARDGAEALRVVLGGKRVDAIICDIGMPKLDGPTFFSELFELRPQMMPRVVFCTGGTPNEKTQRFLDRLQAPLLFKPVAAVDLRSAIAYVRSR
jgi:CheY-like chemotaxis protein